VQEPHGGGVAQRVRCDVLAGQRRAGAGRARSVVGDSVLECVQAQGPALPGREQRIGGLAGAFGQPDAQDGDGAGAGGQRDDAVFASFAVAADVRSDAEVDVCAGQCGQLGGSQAGLGGQ